MLSCHVCGAPILRLGDPCPDWSAHQLAPHADTERSLAECSAPSEQDHEDALLAGYLSWEAYRDAVAAGVKGRTRPRR